MQIFHSILVVATLFLLISCGFKPIYKTTNNKTYEFLQEIELTQPSTIEGAEFYNQLKNIIPPSLRAKYILETKLNFSQDFSIIEKNSDALREIITLKVSYILKMSPLPPCVGLVWVADGCACTVYSNQINKI